MTARRPLAAKARRALAAKDASSSERDLGAPHLEESTECEDASNNGGVSAAHSRASASGGVSMTDASLINLGNALSRAYSAPKLATRQRPTALFDFFRVVETVSGCSENDRNCSGKPRTRVR